MLYPLNVDLTGRLIVVVGGGIVAERKVTGILAAGEMSFVRVIAPAVTAQLRYARRSIFGLCGDGRPYG